MKKKPSKTKRPAGQVDRVVQTRKISADEQRSLIPDEAIRAAFMRRDDIRSLPAKERNKRWATHLKKVNEFRNQLAQLDGIVISV